MEEFQLQEFLEFLFLRTWWSYEDSADRLFSELYHWFNLFEGGAWIVLGIAVFVRYLRNRRSQLEIWYSVAFITFGISDFREAYVQSSWLIWLKLFNLIVLFYLRRLVITRYYPSCKLI